MVGQQGAAETSALLATAKNGESDRRRTTGAVDIGVLLTVLVLLVRRFFARLLPPPPATSQPLFIILT